MDALSAAAPVGKKDALKKRKRRTSSSTKESSNQDDSGTEATTPTTPTTPTGTSPPKMTAPKFYQDTLDDAANEEEKDDKESKTNDNLNESTRTISDDDDEDDIPLKRLKESEDEKAHKSTTENSDKVEKEKEIEPEVAEVGPKPPGPGCGPNGPPGVLVIHRRRGPKKQLKWKPQENLEEIRYFELDETERVNVTKNFTDAKVMERCMEREAMVNVRSNKYAHDRMEADIDWMPLYEVDGVPPHPDGGQSNEKKIQIDREKTVLKVLYFSRHMVPDSPAEPDMEYYQITDPQIIPLDDITRNPEAVNDLTNMAWPDPKGSPPHIPAGLGMPFGNNPLFNPSFMPPMDMPRNGWPIQNNNMMRMPMGAGFGPSGIGAPGMGVPPGMGGPGMGGPGMGGPPPGMGGPPGLMNAGLGMLNMAGPPPGMGGPPPGMGGPPNMNGPGMGGPNILNNGPRNNGPPGQFNMNPNMMNMKDNMMNMNGPPPNQNGNWFRPSGPPPNWMNNKNHGPRGFNHNGPRNWGRQNNNNRFGGRGGGAGGDRHRDKW